MHTHWNEYVRVFFIVLGIYNFAIFLLCFCVYLDKNSGYAQGKGSTDWLYCKPPGALTVHHTRAVSTFTMGKIVIFCPNIKNAILLPKLFWPTVRKKCSSDKDFFYEIQGCRPSIYKNFGIPRTIYSNSERSEPCFW